MAQANTAAADDDHAPTPPTLHVTQSEESRLWKMSDDSKAMSTDSKANPPSLTAQHSLGGGAFPAPPQGSLGSFMSITSQDMADVLGSLPSEDIIGGTVPPSGTIRTAPTAAARAADSDADASASSSSSEEEETETVVVTTASGRKVKTTKRRRSSTKSSTTDDDDDDESYGARRVPPKKRARMAVCPVASTRGALPALVELNPSGDKRYRCKQCGRQFRGKSEIVCHVRTHTGERPHVCSEPGCGRRFAHSSNLRAHERSHRGEKPYRCLYAGCNKAFAHSVSLKEHHWAHEGTKPYACTEPGCGKRFTQMSNFTRHKKLHQKKRDAEAAQQLFRQQQRDVVMTAPSPFAEPPRLVRSSSNAAPAG